MENADSRLKHFVVVAI